MLRTLCALAIATFGAPPAHVERWDHLGVGTFDGRLVSYAIEGTLPLSHAMIRPSHWQVIFLEGPLAGVKEYRFVDLVDCERNWAAHVLTESFDERGNLLKRVKQDMPNVDWEPLTAESIQGKADGFACIGGPEK